MPESKSNKILFIQIFVQFVALLLQAGIFFAGQWNFRITAACLYFPFAFLLATIASVIIWKLNPEVMANRMGSKKDSKSWDRKILLIWVILSTFGIPFIAGIDIAKNGNNFNAALASMGYFLCIISAVFINWAMIKNKHFETTVRIQNDRSHKVVTDGPYKLIRHPGYLGMILSILSIPCMLSSYWAFIPAGASVIVLIFRTAREDTTLKKELYGYIEYSQKTKYRIIPLVW